jgi:iron complex transport system permease protein
MKRAQIYVGLVAILVAIFLIHNHSITAYQPTSRGIGLIVIGAALGVTSTLFQGFYKNQIADPGLMGISTGAALGAVVAIKLGNEFGSRIGILISVLFAFVSFYVFDWVRARFVVNGILLTLIFSTPIILITSKSHPDSFFWSLGSFHELTKVHVKIFAPFVEVGIITSFYIARKIAENSAKTKLLVGIGSAFLIGPFTNVTGALIGFGIFIPHLTRLVVKGDTRRVLSFAALVAPIILLLLDILINKLNEISVTLMALVLTFVLSRFCKKQTQGQA